MIEATEEAAGRLSDADDRVREMISTSDDFSVNFEDKTVQELKDYIPNVNQQLQDLLTEIY